MLCHERVSAVLRRRFPLSIAIDQKWAQPKDRK
jgi:hypothetical protein